MTELNLGDQPGSLPVIPKPITVQFTGHGADYFPIWITNLLLTVLTFGIYGPWAKVRREKYFSQHTIIDGDALDYTGNPVKILIGRIITTVLGLLLYAKDFSLWLAVGAAVALAVIIPFAMQRSLRFRLHNTTYRGLRFGFNGSVAKSYAIAAIPLILGTLTFIVPTFFMETNTKEPPIWIFFSFAGLALLYPIFHALWRRYAIEYSHFGTAYLRTTLSTTRFLSTYIFAALIIGGIVAAIVGIGFIGGLAAMIPAMMTTGSGGTSFFLIGLAGIALFYACILSFMPLVTAMLQNLCWNKTTFVTTTNGTQVSEFLSTLHVRKFVFLQLKNIILTILTLGLYRPYAAIATARAKLQAIGLSDFNFIEMVMADSEKQDSALGDEAIDLLDFDFSL